MYRLKTILVLWLPPCPHLVGDTIAIWVYEVKTRSLTCYSPTGVSYSPPPLLVEASVSTGFWGKAHSLTCYPPAGVSYSPPLALLVEPSAPAGFGVLRLSAWVSQCHLGS